MDRRNSAKKMTPVQIDIARKIKHVENLGTTNNLNPRDDLEQALTNCLKDVPYDQWEVFVEQCTTSEYKESRRKHIDDGKNHKLPHACSRLGYPRLEHKMRIWVFGGGDNLGCYNGCGVAVGLFRDSGGMSVRCCRWSFGLLAQIDSAGALYRPNQISAQDETTLPESNKLASQGNHIPSRPIKYKLFWLTPSNVVATGHWYNEEPTCKVHNVPLGIGMLKVSIQIALKKDVPLARGNDHLKTIGDACGSFVAWPTPFIIKEKDSTSLITSSDNYECILADDMEQAQHTESDRQILNQFEATFKAVELWLVDKAVLPIENTLGGNIHRNCDLLLRHRLPIVGEVQLAVNHYLLGLPGVKKDDLKRVLSHPQALAQCEMYLTKLGVVRESTDNTAGTAPFVALNGLKDTGAVASARATDIYGLKVLAEKILDDFENITYFLILAREPIIPKVDRPFKTSIVFTLEKDLEFFLKLWLSFL
ncbi:hypothetical protein GIB67_001766 [Kingdonia uniflora]|uniref:Prephenate dehydratase domain-containing protein n=1 Tax=Kingdonia uniflora TaxID=39325 RepID=A0A7J7LBM3_9MAGN|nr:hypothetical protein GIB67_001766 [Kingdonia uniflora]